MKKKNCHKGLQLAIFLENNLWVNGGKKYICRECIIFILQCSQKRLIAEMCIILMYWIFFIHLRAKSCGCRVSKILMTTLQITTSNQTCKILNVSRLPNFVQ